MQSNMKPFVEKMSNEMGYEGEINEQVMLEANRVLQEYGLKTVDLMDLIHIEVNSDEEI